MTEAPARGSLKSHRHQPPHPPRAAARGEGEGEGEGEGSRSTSSSGSPRRPAARPATGPAESPAGVEGGEERRPSARRANRRTTTSSTPGSKASSRSVHIAVLNGPNLNLLGEREPEVYGRSTLADVEEAVRARARELDVTVSWAQTNHEGAFVEAVQGIKGKADGALVN